MDEYIAVETVNALAAGRFVALVTGEHVMLSADEADDLLRVGYVVPIHEGQEAEVGAVERAALRPAERATAPAQEARRKRGVGG
jgi:hypothetical protein